MRTVEQVRLEVETVERFMNRHSDEFRKRNKRLKEVVNSLPPDMRIDIQNGKRKITPAWKRAKAQRDLAFTRHTWSCGVLGSQLKDLKRELTEIENINAGLTIPVLSNGSL